MATCESASSRVVKRFNGSELLTFQHCQACASARADMTDLVGESQLRNGCRTVAAADDADRLAIRDGLSNRFRTLVERRHLEHAHGAIPNHGFGITDHVRESNLSLGSDIKPFPAIIDVPFENPFVAIAIECIARVCVHGKQ